MKNKIKRFEDFETFNEEAVATVGASTDGGGGFTGPVAFANLATVSGMGNPTTSQPSSIPGDANGATTGSGDIGSGWAKAKQLNSLRNDMQGKKRKNPIGDMFGKSDRRNSKLTRGLKNKNKDGGVFLANDLGKFKSKAGKIKSFKDFK